MFTLKINGVDISPYIKQGGVEWSRNDIDGSNAGRDINGKMIRDFIASKDKLKITLRPVTGEELSTVLNLLSMQHHKFAGIDKIVSVEYNDPATIDSFQLEMYCSSVTSGFLLKRGVSIPWSGNDLWSGASFSLIEV